ncbi:hypothetical protein KSD_34060 [Ktedonobacter sp. SOSP1-85]|uniref:DUF5679 domain-containing protein n=1 Tax=Ktedonobacter sp. SOSP1-85 TaxID=2778367 RepID=UPI001915C939|nr:DUF5679 domain-containing protein [Ktedonobacter sp. SOSP1-85]GHO75635.1 hypothetical protein KSD_34060 [Ktedonobacter sp. SOSP1-85]
MSQIGVVLRRSMRLLLLVLASSAAFILVYILRKNVFKSAPASEENETITLPPISLATPSAFVPAASSEAALEKVAVQSNPAVDSPLTLSEEPVPPLARSIQTPEVVTDEDVELATLDPAVSGQTETIAASTPNDSLPADTSDIIAQTTSEESVQPVSAPERQDEGISGLQEPERVTESEQEPLAAVTGSKEEVGVSSEPASPSEPQASAETAVAYCVKCRTRREMQAPERSVTKNGRSALVGHCPVCGTKLFRFITG